MRSTSKRAAAFLIASIGMASQADAQSNVTIYGVLDIGVQRDTNANGAGLTKEEVRHEPAMMGYRGREDLGGGSAAIFKLEGTLALDTGAGGTFNREAFVGLTNTTYGTVTMGRLYDSVAELVGVDPPRFNSVNAVHVGNWDRTSGKYLSNAVKYRTPDVAGFAGSLMYVFKEDGSNTENTGDAKGINLTYLGGPLRVSAAYLSVNGVTHKPFNDIGAGSLWGVSFQGLPAKTIVTNDKIYGMGAYYDFPQWRVLGEFTSTSLSANSRTEKLQTITVGLVKNPSSIGFRPGVGMNYSRLDSSRWTAAYGILDYYFSKRTDVYARVVGQRASGPNQVAAMYVEGPSSNNHQAVYGIGITTRF